MAGEELLAESTPAFSKVAWCDSVGLPEDIQVVQPRCIAAPSIFLCPRVLSVESKDAASSESEPESELAHEPLEAPECSKCCSAAGGKVCTQQDPSQTEEASPDEAAAEPVVDHEETGLEAGAVDIPESTDCEAEKAARQPVTSSASSATTSVEAAIARKLRMRAKSNAKAKKKPHAEDKAVVGKQLSNRADGPHGGAGVEKKGQKTSINDKNVPNEESKDGQKDSSSKRDKRRKSTKITSERRESKENKENVVHAVQHKHKQRGRQKTDPDSTSSPDKKTDSQTTVGTITSEPSQRRPSIRSLQVNVGPNDLATAEKSSSSSSPVDTIVLPPDEGSDILLHVYDLTRATKMLGLAFYHLGIEVHGVELCFGVDGITWCNPGSMTGHVHKLAIKLGYTYWNWDKVSKLVNRLSHEWSGSSYKILKRNCQTFAVAFCEQLNLPQDCIPEDYRKYANTKSQPRQASVMFPGSLANAMGRH